MFRITEDPSRGSLAQCLAKNYKNRSISPVDMDVIGVMAGYCDRSVLWQDIVTDRCYGRIL